MLKDTLTAAEKQASREKSWEVKGLCVQFLMPLLKKVAVHLDQRLVNTLIDLVVVLIIHRDRQQGMVISELGGGQTDRQSTAFEEMAQPSDRRRVVGAGGCQGGAAELRQ